MAVFWPSSLFILAIFQSVAEFSALRSLNGDDGWKVQVEEAVIRYVGDAVLFGEKSVDLVR